MKILVVEDHRLFRDLFVQLLESLTNDTCLAAGNGQEALGLLKSNKVDVTFLDISMPVMNGFDTFNAIKEKYPAMKIVMLSQHNEKGVISHFIQQGASGFLTKDCDADELKKLLHSIETGHKYFSNEVMAIVSDFLNEMSVLSNQLQISPQEKRVIELLNQGLTSKELADVMKLKIKTVTSYRENLLVKTKTKNVAELISFSYRCGLLH